MVEKRNQGKNEYGRLLEYGLNFFFQVVTHLYSEHYFITFLQYYKNGSKWYELEPSRDKGGDLNRYGRFLGYGRKCVFGKNVDVVVNQGMVVKLFQEICWYGRLLGYGRLIGTEEQVGKGVGGGLISLPFTF